MVERQNQDNGFEEWLILRRYSLRYIENMLLYQKVFHRDYVSNDEINQETINKFLKEHNSPTEKAFLHNYFEYLGVPEDSYEIPKHKGRHQKKITGYITKDEVYYLVVELEERMQHHLALLVSFMFEGGMRISEALKVKWKDVNLDEGLIKVLGKGNKERLVSVGNRTIALLNKYEEIKQNDDLNNLILGNRLKNQRNDLRKKLVNLSQDILSKSIHPHMLRHSCGFYLRDLGWQLDAIQLYLGHSDIKTTVIYTHADQKKVVQQAKGLWDGN